MISPMMTLFPLIRPQISRPFAILAALALCVVAMLGARVIWAQVSGDRGVSAVAATTDIEVSGIEVSATGDSAEEARANGWREAQRKAWAQINGPKLPDSRLDSLVSAIVVEKEQIGLRHYVATLGVVFDRQRAGALIGGRGQRARSAPMLTLPVLISGGAATMFEARNPWQSAWAEYQAGGSTIDYVRPSGAGGESLLLNYGQTAQRSRVWWNVILDQFGAADVLVPMARLEWDYPGGPVTGHFTARYGPDNRYLDQFSLRAKDTGQLEPMLQQAVRRFDTVFSAALANGTLTPDPSLSVDSFEVTPGIRALIAAGEAAERADRAAAQADRAPAAESAAPASTQNAVEAPVAAVTISSFTVQVSTPDGAALDGALSGLRGVAGVSGVATNSLAIGGTSVLRVSYAGDLAGLAAGLSAQGWAVTQGNNALAISR